jgi:hypothetical protein
MLGLGLGLPKIGNKIVAVIGRLKEYWATNMHKWDHENHAWDHI